MMAEHHADRRALNARARALLQAAGELTGPELTAVRQNFQAGDEVICRTPERRIHPPGRPDLHLRNGTRGIVRAVRLPGGPHPAGLIVDFDGRGTLHVPLDYLEREIRPGVRGGLTHSYALTTHAAQGDTYEAGRVVLSDSSTREGLYVGLTRGRAEAQAYAVRRRDLADEPDSGLPAVRDERDTLDLVADHLATRRPDQLVIDRDPDALAVADVARSTTLAELEARGRSEGELDPISARAEREIERRVALAAILDPPADLAELGPRPSDPVARRDWDRAVGLATIDRCRHDLAPALDADSPQERLVESRPDDVRHAATHDLIARLSACSAPRRARAGHMTFVADPPFEQDLD